MTLAGEADRDRHGRLQRRIAGGRLVFIDESGVTTSMTPSGFSCWRGFAACRGRRSRRRRATKQTRANPLQPVVGPSLARRRCCGRQLKVSRAVGAAGLPVVSVRDAGETPVPWNAGSGGSHGGCRSEMPAKLPCVRALILAGLTVMSKRDAGGNSGAFECGFWRVSR